MKTRESERGEPTPSPTNTKPVFRVHENAAPLKLRVAMAVDGGPDVFRVHENAAPLKRREQRCNQLRPHGFPRS